MTATRPWAFWACGEYRGVLPDGRTKPADESAREHWRVEAGGRVEVAAPRNGWASLRVVVEGAGQFAPACRLDGEGIRCDLYREFYHKMADQDVWYADALVPIEPGTPLVLPDPDNRVPDQTAQGIWVDLFVARDAEVGPHTGRLVLTADGEALAIDLAINVLDLTYPDEDCIYLDHNSYGSTFLQKQYPTTVPAQEGPGQIDAFIDLIHKYHALIFEHHGIYHQLGFGHSGVTSNLFAPGAEGEGRNRHLTDWRIYDRHYGPLCDGSAFDGCRRKAMPIYAIYTPFTPAWPADYVGFGGEGYEVELINGLRDFDAHFRENGWTNTILEYFFNHKKRFRYFGWDGDEPRYATDDVYWRRYRRILDKAVSGSPVLWKFRSDSSWMMKEHWTTLADVVDFWVCGGFVDAWEKEAHEGPMARGDVVWTYSGGTGVADPSADIIQYAYRTWIRDFTGNVNWLTTNPGSDPWFNCDGARTAMMYTGDRFGIDGPIPSIRLKVQRNAMQDINLLERVAQARGKDAVKADLIPTIPIELWHPPTKGQLELPPHEWTSAVYGRSVEPDQREVKSIDPLWWDAVRTYARTNAQEVSRG